MADGFSERTFWSKAKRVAGKVPMVLDAVASYFCMLDSRTPLWAKTAIVTALAYFVNPADAIPDVLGPVGYTDDAAVLTGTITVLGNQLREEHYEQAREALDMA